MQVNAPVLRIPLTGTNVDVAITPEGQRIVEIGPLVVSFVLPIDRVAAQELARMLAGGVDLSAAALAPSIRERGGFLT
jgi:hypothetical protein